MPEEKKSKVEIIKENSNGLRGTIREELERDSDHFSHEDYQVMKFHGIYQQDDRDVRQQRKKEGKDRKYIFMVRTKNPGGGELSPEQWEVLNKASDLHADGTLRITTREDIQFHGVGKENLRNTIRLLNSELISTYGACGDGNRNTVACPVANIRKGSIFDGQEWAHLISDHLSFKTKAYYDVWLNGERITKFEGESIPEDENETETLYGKAYLPRKFKVGIGLPDDNCIDVHTQDVGIIPILNDTLKGFNVLIGGGLGSTHRQTKTYPRLADPIAFVPPGKLIDVVTRIVETQRDYGDRADRKHARLKYVVEEWGVERFKEELERRLGYKLSDPESIELHQIESHLGWHEQNTPGLWYVGIFVENGRVRDSERCMMKTGLREIIKEFRPGVRLTPIQDIILTNIPEGKIDDAKSALREYGIKTERQFSKLRINSMACPALPTCGLALAESERFLPYLIDELEKRGYGDNGIKIRMSGCPNACSRPPVAEIGIMGTSPEKYNLYVGGSFTGTRLNQLYGELVDANDLADRIGELIDIHRLNKKPGESFGDFCNRLGVEQLKEIRSRLYQKRQRAVGD
ncbi:MAG TPA: NADPH-dependent assimilatory sulfite reductase hemoprotein subunit [Thermodesulfobacteriota bacterium]|nr:NADPH-dependent assimilatory sulfite reductase hemoprotein subunit [Thermodesulfobacteriota bacterium]